MWLMLVGSGLLTVSLVYIALDLPSVGNRQRGQAAVHPGLVSPPLVVATSAFTLVLGVVAHAGRHAPVTLSGLL